MNRVHSLLVSVIVPVYNVEKYIDACLDSIRQQSHPNLEILVVEDCSTDRSLKALQPHLLDERIRLIQHEQNGGLSAARNTGIEVASGDYIMFVDSDDVVDRQLVEACINSAILSGADLVTYGFATFDDGKSTSDGQFAAADLARQAVVLGDEYFQLQNFAWLKFIHARVLRSMDIQFPVGLYYEDWPFHWHLGLVTTSKIQLNAKLYHYRQRGTSITGSTGRKLLDIFTVQELVMELVVDQGSKLLHGILEGKIRDSHWSVLTRIDDNLLGIALDKAQSADKIMRANGVVSAPRNWRRYVISSIVRLPRSISLMVLRILRMMLRKAVAARRKSLTTTTCS